MFRRVSTLFLRAQRFLCQLPYLAYAVHVCPQSSCGVGSLLFCLSSESVSVDEVPSDLTPPHRLCWQKLGAALHVCFV